MIPNEEVVYILNEQYPGLSPTQFGFQECHPGHSFGPSVRPFWLLHYVISGTGIFTRNGTTYQIAPGEIFVIPPKPTKRIRGIIFGLVLSTRMKCPECLRHRCFGFREPARFSRKCAAVKGWTTDGVRI